MSVGGVLLVAWGGLLVVEGVAALVWAWRGTGVDRPSGEPWWNPVAVAVLGASSVWAGVLLVAVVTGATS